MAEVQKELATKVTTGKVRFSYLNAFEPKCPPNSTKPKYSVSAIISKSDTKTLTAIRAAIAIAIDQGTKGKWGGKQPPAALLKMPLRDGDVERPDDEAYKNAFFFNANSDNAPGLVSGLNPNLAPITDRNLLYSGCYGRLSVNFYPFNQAGSKGIAVGWNNLQKLEDGEPLSSRSTPDADFGDDFADASDML